MPHSASISSYDCHAYPYCPQSNITTSLGLPSVSVRDVLRVWAVCTPPLHALTPRTVEPSELTTPRHANRLLLHASRAVSDEITGTFQLRSLHPPTMLPAWLKRARPRICCPHHPHLILPPSLLQPSNRFSTAAPSASEFSSASDGPSAPERILIIGCGITGLALAHFLRQLPHPPHIARPHISLVDAQLRHGGWIDTQLPSTACPYLFERGPRSLLTRRGDSTLALIQELRLQDDIVLADVASKRRYVWDSRQHKLVLLPTGINSSLIRFPFLGSVVSGAWHELRAPPRSTESAAECEDESVGSFITRRFNSTVAQELIDPLAAGIYTGDIQQLSLRSCFPVLHAAEQQSGSVVRHLLSAPAASKEWMEGEEQVQAEEWVKTVKRNGTYSFTGGLRMLTDRLFGELVRAGVARGVDVRVGTTVEKLVLSEEGVKAAISGFEERYDRVISTISATALARILHRSTFSAQPTSTDTQHSPILQSPSTSTNGSTSALQFVDLRPSLSSTALLSSLCTSLSSLPYANVWVVNLAYPPSTLRTPAFGLLCASHHSTDGLLGIAFDSCVFPEQGDSLPGVEPATRLTVMMGGARFPHLAHSSAAAVQSAAVAAVRDKLGVNVEPLWLEARLATECIPQYVLGHSRWVKGVEDGLEALNARLAGGASTRRLNVLGNAMYGVSVNDLVTRAKLFATQYYGKRVTMTSDAADTGSEAGILPATAR